MKRTFEVEVTVYEDGYPTGTCVRDITIDPDDIYQAGIDADLRAMARRAEFRAGLRETEELR